MTFPQANCDNYLFILFIFLILPWSNVGFDYKEQQLSGPFLHKYIANTINCVKCTVQYYQVDISGSPMDIYLKQLYSLYLFARASCLSHLSVLPLVRRNIGHQGLCQHRQARLSRLRHFRPAHLSDSQGQITKLYSFGLK